MFAIYNRGPNTSSFPRRRAEFIASLAVHCAVITAVVLFYRPSPRRFLPPAPTGSAIVRIDFPTVESSVRSSADGPQRPNVGVALSAPESTPVASERGREPGPAAEMSTATSSTGASGARAAEVSNFQAGIRDTRLYVDPRALRPPGPAAAPYSRIAPDALAALRAFEDSVAVDKQRALEARQVEIAGARITVFGERAPSRLQPFSTPLHNWRTLPVDGRRWEDLELDRQADGFLRDSTLRARAQATRERANRERSPTP